MLTISVEPRPSFVAYTGVPERLVAATFTESDQALTAADFAATIDWGDGTTSAGDVAEAADGTFSVSAPKTYADPGSFPIGQGSYPVTVTISSPLNGDMASTAEVDSSLLAATGNGGHSTGASRGVADGNQGHYVADYAAGLVVDYEYVVGGSPFLTVPGPGGTTSPTGLALLPGANDSLVIVTADGTIAVWTNSGVPGIPPAGQAATTVVDHSASGADYEGVTVGTIPTAGGGTESVIYVANFASGKVEAYDAGTFAPVDLGAGAFTDPGLPAEYAPFNVQDLNGTVYVAFAEQSGAKGQAVDGAGKGYLDAFDPSGHLLARLDAIGGLNAPSGIALAPSDMGPYAGHLLVASTGDGTVSVLDPNDPSAPAGGRPGVLGKVAGPGGGPLVIDGLWGLSAMTGHSDGSTDSYLYASSAVGGDQLGGFYYNPTLACVSARPTTGVANAPDLTLDFLGGPSHVLWLGQFVDAAGAVDGSDAGGLSVTIDWGDGSAPAAGSLTFQSGSNLPSGADYTISGTAPYTTPGTYHANVTVAMAGGASYTHDVSVTVLDGTDPIVAPIGVPVGPVLSTGAGAAPPTISMVPSVTATATAPASVSLGSFMGPIAAYTVAIDWRDGSAPSFGQLVPAPGAGSTYYTISGTHNYKLAGTYTVTIDLLGPGGLSEFASTKADVAPSRLRLDGNSGVLKAVQGQALTAGPGTFTFDGGAGLPTSDFIANVDWRDGSPPTRAEVDLVLPPSGTAHPYYAVDATHTYRTAGAYAPLINVIAPDGESWWALDSAAVAPDPAGPTNVMPGAALVATRGEATPDSLLATFDAPAGIYMGAVAWGDGSAPVFVSVRPIGPDGALVEYGVYGSHTYAAAGNFRPLVGIIAPDGDLDPVADFADVLDPPGAPSRVSAAPVSGYAGVGLTGSLVSFDGWDNGDVGYRAVIDWGDGSAPIFGAIRSVPYPGPALPLAGAGFLVDGTHAYAATGTYTIKIDILAPDGSSIWATTTSTVTAAPAPSPMNFDPQGAVGVERGMPTAGIIVALFSSAPGPYMASVDWGDGSASSPAAIVPLAIPALVGYDGTNWGIQGAHTYMAPGTYPVTVYLARHGGERDRIEATATITPATPTPYRAPVPTVAATARARSPTGRAWAEMGARRAPYERESAAGPPTSTNRPQ